MTDPRTFSDRDLPLDELKILAAFGDVMNADALLSAEESETLSKLARTIATLGVNRVTVARFDFDEETEALLAKMLGAYCFEKQRQDREIRERGIG